MNRHPYTRRQFVKGSSTLAVGAGAVLAGCSPGSKKGNPLVPGTPTNPVTPGDGITIIPQNKALVFILLDGGNDSYNMLVPLSDAGFNQYKTSRSNLAHPKNQLLPLSDFVDGRNQRYGVHPSLKKTQSLFNDKKLAFIANVGPMVEPVTKSEFIAGSKPLPVGLMSHSDQTKHWMTANPGVRTNTGWFGKLSDELQRNKDANAISMNISLDGSNIAQNGVHTSEYAITKNGSVGLVVKESGQFPGQNALNQELLRGFDAIMGTKPSGAFQETFAAKTRYAQAQHETFRAATSGISVDTVFSDTDLSEQLKMVAKTIKAAPAIGTQQQTFFIRYRGWDHHDELLNTQARMLAVLDNALFEFQTALEALGIDDKVLTFTGSDFGRTLTSNGNGTDHGWGGNSLVMGKDVAGGKIYGEYPSLALGAANPLDVGDGVLIPTTSTDEVYAELAVWFGVQRGDLGKLLPNLPNFYNHLTAESGPLGIVA